MRAIELLALILIYIEEFYIRIEREFTFFLLRHMFNIEKLFIHSDLKNI